MLLKALLGDPKIRHSLHEAKIASKSCLPLFGISDLYPNNPGDILKYGKYFKNCADETLKYCKFIQAEKCNLTFCTTLDRTIDYFDEISNSLSSILDLSNFFMSTPNISPILKNISHDINQLFLPYLDTLNCNSELRNLLLSSLNGRSTRIFTEKACESFLRDFIATSDAKRFVKLQEEMRVNSCSLIELLKTKKDFASLMGFPSYSHYILSKISQNFENPHQIEIFLRSELKRPIFHELNLQANEEIRVPLASVFDVLAKVLNDVFDLSLHLSEDNTNEIFWSKDVIKLDLIQKSQLLGHIYINFMKGTQNNCQSAHYSIKSYKNKLMSPTYLYPNLISNQLPIVVLNCFLQQKEDNSLSTCSFYDVKCILHEFGHALHSILARFHYQQISGTRCRLEFTEIPSTFFEMLITTEYFLGCILPGKTSKFIKEKARELRRYFNFENQNNIQFALIDNELHSKGLSPKVSRYFQNRSAINHLIAYGGFYYVYPFAYKTVCDYLLPLFLQHSKLDSSDEDYLITKHKLKNFLFENTNYL